MPPISPSPLTREICILVAFHALLNDTEEYERLKSADGKLTSCEDSTAEYAVRYGEALWRRIQPKKYPTNEQ